LKGKNKYLSDEITTFLLQHPNIRIGKLLLDLIKYGRKDLIKEIKDEKIEREDFEDYDLIYKKLLAT
jgi:hypothetical protein